MDMKLLHQKFCKETFGPTGVIKKFEPVYGEDFNFAYDVIDAIAKEEPARRAMVWCNVAGEKRTFTFGEMAGLRLPGGPAVFRPWHPPGGPGDAGVKAPLPVLAGNPRAA